MAIPQGKLEFVAKRAGESRSQVVIQPPRLGGAEISRELISSTCAKQEGETPSGCGM